MAIPRRRVSGRHTLFHLFPTVDGASPRHVAVASWDIGVARRNDHAARCRQLRWGRRRRSHTDVGRDVPPSGGGDPGGTRRGRQPINI